MAIFCTEIVIKNTTLWCSMEIKRGNKRVAFIGRSSSGKTTLVNEFINRGYQAVPEMAREVLMERQGYDATPEENLIRQKMIYERQRGLEESVSGLSFHDRGLVDILGYTRMFSLDDSFIDVNLLRGRYEVVFELEKRPFISDGIRIEKDSKEADRVFSYVKEGYSELGYETVTVPNFCDEREENAKQRMEFILDKLKEREA